VKTPTLKSCDGAAIEAFKRGFYGQALLPGGAIYVSKLGVRILMRARWR
jgi:hypothetical protein